MIHTLIGQKVDQVQGFLENGVRIPVTKIAMSGNTVTLLKTQEKSGYSAIQLGFGTRKRAKKTSPLFLREVRIIDGEVLLQVGDEVKPSDVFEPGDIIDVSGVSKGKGYAGGVKRYHFKGGPRTHGQSDRERAPGSIGQTTTPGRVYKGKRMAGNMGHVNVTIKNLQVVAVLDDYLLVRGLIPGPKNSIVTVIKRGKNKKFVPLYQEAEKEEEKNAS